MAKPGPKPKKKADVNVKTEPKTTENETEDKKPEIKTKKPKETPSFMINLPNKDFFRLDEVSRYLGRAESTIRLWAVNGYLDRIKVRGCIFYTRESIIECMASNVMKPKN